MPMRQMHYRYDFSVMVIADNRFERAAHCQSFPVSSLAFLAQNLRNDIVHVFLSIFKKENIESFSST